VILEGGLLKHFFHFESRLLSVGGFPSGSTLSLLPRRAHFGFGRCAPQRPIFNPCSDFFWTVGSTVSAAGFLLSFPAAWEVRPRWPAQLAGGGQICFKGVLGRGGESQLWRKTIQVSPYQLPLTGGTFGIFRP